MKKCTKTKTTINSKIHQMKRPSQQAIVAIIKAADDLEDIKATTEALKVELQANSMAIVDSVESMGIRSLNATRNKVKTTATNKATTTIEVEDIEAATMPITTTMVTTTTIKATTTAAIAAIKTRQILWVMSSNIKVHLWQQSHWWIHMIAGSWILELLSIWQLIKISSQHTHLLIHHIIDGICDFATQALGKGTIQMMLHIDGQPTCDSFNNILYIPNLGKNLFLVGKMMHERQHNLHIKNDKMIISTLGGKPVLTGTEFNNVYYVDGKVYIEQVNSATATNEMQLWHKCLGHINADNLWFMIQNHTVQGLTSTSSELEFCESCAINKLTHLPFPSGGNWTNDKLQIIHSDLCGPMKTQTIQGNHYFITFIDDFSRQAQVYFIKLKDQSFNKFCKFKAQVENETSFWIKTLQTDGGSEYINSQFRSFLKDYGIQHQVMAPYSLQQNGVAKQFNHTVVEMAHTMLHNANLSYLFWAEAVNTAIYIWNWCISCALNSKYIMPEELWSGHKLSMRHLWIFGCNAYILINDYWHKFEPKVEKCILVGYSTKSKAYWLWSHEKWKIIISQDVKFNELTFEHTSIPTFQQNIITNKHTEPLNTLVDQTTIQQPALLTLKSKAKAHLCKELYTDLGSYWNESTSESQAQTSFASAFAYAATILVKLQTYDEAITSPDAIKWKSTMDIKYQSLLENDTWDLTPLPPNCTMIDTWWLYQIKQTPEGKIKWYKAQLVTKGFAQNYGIDYDEMYSPVYKLVSLHIILAIGAILDLKIHQLNVKTAFLNGNINTKIYIKQPQGYEKDPNLVCKLRKGIYGLKQSPQLWNQWIDSFLTRIGFKWCQSDLCIYHQWTAEGIILLGLWVDDITIISSPNLLDYIKTTLKNKFKMMDQGKISFILGISIMHDHSKWQIYLQQPCYIYSLLEHFNMTKCKAVSTPIKPSMQLFKPSNKNNNNSVAFHALYAAPTTFCQPANAWGWCLRSWRVSCRIWRKSMQAFSLYPLFNSNVLAAQASPVRSSCFSHPEATSRTWPRSGWVPETSPFSVIPFLVIIWAVLHTLVIPSRNLLTQHKTWSEILVLVKLLWFLFAQLVACYQKVVILILSIIHF